MSTDYKHAAQIYAQMLGMVCDEKLYANRAAGQPDHQEVPSIHFPVRVACPCPPFALLVNLRPLFCTFVMRRFIFSAPNFPIRIPNRSPDLVLNTVPSRHKKWYFSARLRIGCANRRTRLRFIASWSGCCICSADLVRSDISIWTFGTRSSDGFMGCK